jgi:coenzyme F420-reducing hydrogenase alpha subunit
MKFPILADGTFFRVGPLARVNIAGKMPTPRADEFLNQVKEVLPLPIKSTTGYHLARLAELIYCWEEAGNLVNDTELTSPEVRPKPIKPKAGEGYGIIEAPRGTLVHNYKINDQGFAEKVTLLVATQQNNYAINQSLFYEGKDLTPDSSKDEVALNRLEMLLRSYDPCLSCSTHLLGGPGAKIIWREIEGRG